MEPKNLFDPKPKIFKADALIIGTLIGIFISICYVFWR